MKLSQEEEIWLKKQRSFFKNGEQKGRNVASDFLTPKEQLILQTHLSEYTLSFDGGYENAERRQAHLKVYEQNQPTYTVFQFKYNDRFQTITHRDVLGSLMSLGIDRQQIGDIVINENVIQIITTKKIAPFLFQNVTTIKKASIQLEEVNEVNEKQVEVESSECFVASYRLDVFVSALTKMSRKISDEYIEKGYVQVNHQVMYSSNYQCQVGDLISIRGYGRFTFEALKSQSKKGKYRIVYTYLK